MQKFLVIIFTSLTLGMTYAMNAIAEDFIIDDRSSGTINATSGGQWRVFTDQVMGGVSNGSLKPDRHNGKDCLRMTGQVSTQNNGGFVQITLDLNAGKAFNADAYTGIDIDVAGNNETYNLHYRTSNLWLPWQSYRASFEATPEWNRIRIPFQQMEAYRTGSRLRQDKIKRIGLVAIGRDFEANLCVGAVKFYAN